MTGWNPRYVAYAASNGRGADDQRAHDRALVAPNAGFIVWMGERWTEWRAENGRTSEEYLTDADQAAFDVWLAERCAT